MSFALGCASAGKGDGAAGSTGTPGSAGNNGAAGATGVAGSSGPAGSTGSPGTAGSTGVAGSTGEAGTNGVAGSSGPAGTNGVAGSTGVAGSGPAGRGGSTSGAAGSGATTDGGTDTVCQMANFKFEPKVPTVYILVDRSGSEFQPGDSTKGIYYNLRAAVLQVVQQLQAEVRFGLGVFTGPSNKCPTFDTVPLGLNNYAAINTKYSSLGFPGDFNTDTPAAKVIPMVKAALMADTSPGDKYVLFATDSETDFCDNYGALCPADAVTYLIQDMKAANIGTLVLGLPSAISPISTAVLKNFANAGAGQPVAVPTGASVTDATAVYQMCTGYTPWKQMWTAAGKTGLVPLTTYATTGGTAPVFMPTSDSQSALAAALSNALAGVKSCSFDLGDINGQSIKVDLAQLDSAHIKIEGQEVPIDKGSGNGWKMNGPTQLELTGTACSLWRMPNKTDIDFGFPCSTIIFE